MKSEAALLLDLACNHGQPVFKREGSEIDDPVLVQMAETHQVSALIHWNSTPKSKQQGSPGSPELSEAVRSAFKMAYLHHLMRNHCLFQTLERLADQLESRSIDYVVFKGPWLAREAYPDQGTRPIDDIDLGIQEQDYQGAVEALVTLGYRAEGPLPPNSDQAIRRAHYGQQIRFTADGQRMVELHFRMINIGPPSAREAWLWDNREFLCIGTSRVPIPDPCSMLVHLCLHANQHGYAVLRILLDIRFTLQLLGESLDTDRFLRITRTLRCRSAVFHSLSLAAELTGAAVPSALLEALRPGPLRRGVYRRCWDWEHVRALEAPQRSNRIESPRMYLLEMGSFRDKVRYLAGLSGQAGGPTKLLKSAWKATRTIRD